MTATKKIDLALQGGGSHGAFTWGVLDRILQDDRIDITAISGTSAGAMNAIALADGLTRGGRDAARVALDGFWRAVTHSLGNRQQALRQLQKLQSHAPSL